MSTATATLARDDAWTCVRCDVTIRWMPGHEPTATPAGWDHVDGDPHCLRCRRDHAAEQAVEGAPGVDRAARAKLRAAAVLEFELRRDPDRPNGEIAKAVRCSVPAVVKTRRRIEAEG